MPANLILLRHGQSQWNLENRFTGWVDVDLSENGRNEAVAAGELIAAEGLQPDIAFTSVLTRAIRTLWIVMDRLDALWLPVTRAWQLNERHYGALQGLNKAETAAKYGDEQVHIWRRSYDILPPLMAEDDPGHPKNDRRYAALDAASLPRGESLQSTLDRVLPYWHGEIAPQLRAGKTVIVAAHGNSLRALVKHLDDIGEDEISGLNIPTGVPLVYSMSTDLQVLRSRYLGDQEAIAAKAAAVADQGKG